MFFLQSKLATKYFTELAVQEGQGDLHSQSSVPPTAGDVLLLLLLNKAIRQGAA